MLTLTLEPHYTLLRSVLAPRRLAQSGSAVLQAQRQWARPTYQFTLRSVMKRQAATEYLASFIAYHQGDVPFWWEGHLWETSETPVHVAYGDGVTTQFFLPNRHITNIPDVYVAGVLASPQPSVDSAPGLLTFAAPVTLGAEVTALYTCRYPLVWWVEGETLLTETQTHSMLWDVEGLQAREVVP